MVGDAAGARDGAALSSLARRKPVSPSSLLWGFPVVPADDDNGRRRRIGCRHKNGKHRWSRVFGKAQDGLATFVVNALAFTGRAIKFGVAPAGCGGGRR
jgi:hypothetical protein